MHVRGEENLWARRPAVFIFNHQSAVDMLVLCKLLRRDFLGIGKQEIKRNPIFGPLMSLAWTVFIDRFHHETAIQALQPAIDALRHGFSLAIAPEGTRSTTPHPGPFKNGAFVARALHRAAARRGRGEELCKPWARILRKFRRLLAQHRRRPLKGNPKIEALAACR